MAAKRLTLGQKCIGNGLKTFIIGLQKIKPEEDWTTVGWDIVVLDYGNMHSIYQVK